MTGRFGLLARDELDYGYLQKGNKTEARRTSERTGEFNGKQGKGRPGFKTPVSAGTTGSTKGSGGASDASASAGLDLRYDAIEEKPWCVVKWPEGTEKRFSTKQEAHDYMMSIDEEEFWDEGNGAARDRDRMR